MPTFYSETEIDISVEEFVDQLPDWELDELIEIVNNMQSNNVPVNNGASLAVDEINIALDKLARNSRLLTVEEEEYIKKLADKFL